MSCELKFISICKYDLLPTQEITSGALKQALLGRSASSAPVDLLLIDNLVCLRPVCPPPPPSRLFHQTCLKFRTPLKQSNEKLKTRQPQLSDEDKEGNLLKNDILINLMA